MAENPVMLPFQNNCEAINSNCVEVVDETEEKITNNDITIATNKPEAEPSCGVQDGTPEDAVEKLLLAGENEKDDFHDDLLLETIEAENDGIDFKTENVIMDCPDIKHQFFQEIPEEDDLDDETEKGEPFQTSPLPDDTETDG